MAVVPSALEVWGGEMGRLQRAVESAAHSQEILHWSRTGKKIKVHQSESSLELDS